MSSQELKACREAFEAYCQPMALDLSQKNDVWGRLFYMHSHIQVMWEAWRAAWNTRPQSEAGLRDKLNASKPFLSLCMTAGLNPCAQAEIIANDVGALSPSAGDFVLVPRELLAKLRDAVTFAREGLDLLEREALHEQIDKLSAAPLLSSPSVGVPRQANGTHTLESCPGYSPDVMAMGDCRNCGHVYDAHPARGG